MEDKDDVLDFEEKMEEKPSDEMEYLN